MSKPSTLHDVYCLAKLQEATLASIARRIKPILDRSPSNVRRMGSRFENSSQSWSPTSYRTGSRISPYQNIVVSSIASITSKPKVVGRTLSNKEIDERRAKNLCFFCEEKYFPRHKCSTQVYKLEVIEEENSHAEKETGEMEKDVEEEETRMLEETMQLSLSALSGVSASCTMRVTGRVKNSPLYILLDSDSTHNFLDISTTKRLHCEIRKIPWLMDSNCSVHYMQNF